MCGLLLVLLLNRNLMHRAGLVHLVPPVPDRRLQQQQQQMSSFQKKSKHILFVSIQFLLKWSVILFPNLGT